MGKIFPLRSPGLFLCKILIGFMRAHFGAAKIS